MNETDFSAQLGQAILIDNLWGVNLDVLPDQALFRTVPGKRDEMHVRQTNNAKENKFTE